MGFKQRINYWERVIAAYRKGANSQLTFWHEKPVVNEDMDLKRIFINFSHFCKIKKI